MCSIRALILFAFSAASLSAQTSVFFVPGIGQSNTRGDGGLTGLSSGNPPWVHSNTITSLSGFPNLMMSLDSNFYRVASPTVNLSELLLAGYSGTTDNYESAMTGLINQMTYLAKLVGRNWTGLGGNYASTGVGYSSWGKGGSSTCGNSGLLNCYTGMINGVTESKTLINAMPATAFYPGLWSVAGESDFGSGLTAAQWETNMVALQADYQADRTTATGQTGLAPLFLTQPSNWNSYPASCTYPTTNCTQNGPKGVPFGLNKMLADHYSDGTITVVGPMYQWTYVSNPHLIANQRTGQVEMGYRELGAKLGEAMWHVTQIGQGWKPVAPRSITVVGTAVTIQFFTQSQLVLDPVWTADQVNCGFQVIDSGSGITAIAGGGAACAGNSNVTISGLDKVVLTLNQAPVGTLDVAYAYTAAGGLLPGCGFGPCGNVRDSDPMRCWCNASGTQTVFMYNPSLTFRESAPFSLTLSEPVNLGTIPGTQAAMYWFLRNGQSLQNGAIGDCGSGQPIPCSSGASVTPNGMMLTPTNAGGVTSLPQGALQTLTEAVCKPSDSGCPTPPFTESPATSACNEYTALSGRQCGTANDGWDGLSYAQLSKGGGAGTYEASVGLSACDGSTCGPTFGVKGAQAQWRGAFGGPFFAPAVFWNQGETDMNSTITAAAYELDLVNLQGSQYNTDVNTILSQTGLMPLFLWQKSSWASIYGFGNVYTTPKTNAVAFSGCTPSSAQGADGYCDGPVVGMAQAAVDHYSDGTIFVIGPEYPYPYDSFQGYHMPATSYRKKGCLEGKWMNDVTVHGIAYHPFWPRHIATSGTSLTVRMWPPVGNLAVNTTDIANAADGNWGFEITDSGGATLVPNSATLTGTDTVTLTLSKAVATLEVRYGWTSPNGVCTAQPCTCCSGPTVGPRGNLVDSETRTCWTGDDLLDHALTFREVITSSSPYDYNPAVPNLSTIPGVMPTAGVAGSSIIGASTFKGSVVIHD